jgi:hypothetical protein
VLSRISAWRWRRRALRDAARSLREIEHFDADSWASGPAEPHRAVPPPPPTRRRRTTGAALPGLVITALLLGGIIAFSPGEDMRTVRRMIGMDDDRLGVVPEVEWGRGSFEFSMTQRGSKEPVGYDPCRVIEVEINPEGAPDDYRELVDTAIQHTSDASGLQFEVVGETDRRDFDLAPGGRRPVLVAWSDQDEVADLEGDVAGIGGSIASDLGTGRLSYVTGIVVLDTDVFDGVPLFDSSADQAILDHEFGHLVGLAHVDDRGELMYAENLGRTTYGPGDREGLARLGGIDC